MNAVKQVINDLVIANRILAKEDVVDAYGHVSVRHPEDPKRYFLARSLAPELVTKEDIMEFDLESNPLNDDKRQPYLERFIHGAIFEARPEIMAVVHAHAEDTLPFGIAKNNSTPMRPVIHSGSFIGQHVPVWDIHDHFGDTNLLVSNVDQGRSLASNLGGSNVALMTSHGFAAAGRSLIEVVRISVYLPRNARAILAGRILGGDLRYLTEGEIAARNSGYSPYSPETWRAWEFWANKAGCGKMLSRPDQPKNNK
jgi:ribulose-5-phosphate 4-epimerase/fuculose-1-phosphate aldolase